MTGPQIECKGPPTEWYGPRKPHRVPGPPNLHFNQCILLEMAMRETLDGFQGALQTGGQIVMNLHYTDDIILLATSEAELQELADRLDRVSR